MENNNNTVKVVSWNINAFCKTKKWNDFKDEKRKKWQLDCYTDVLEGIKCLLEIVEKEGIVFLQEIPLQKSDIWSKLEKELEDYNVEFGFNGKNPYICTVMISKKKENDWNKSEKQVRNSKVKYKGAMREAYYNRCIVSNLLDVSVLSVHIPDVRYSPDALILWNDIIEYARTEEPDIIIGDFNTDAEDTPQWRSMKELMNLDRRQVKHYQYYPKRHPKYPTYVEATGSAKRTRVGIPKTFHWDNDGEEQGTHGDYALVRKDIANKVKHYEIIKK